MLAFKKVRNTTKAIVKHVRRGDFFKVFRQRNGHVPPATRRFYARHCSQRGPGRDDVFDKRTSRPRGCREVVQTVFQFGTLRHNGVDVFCIAL